MLQANCEHNLLLTFLLQPAEQRRGKHEEWPCATKSSLRGRKARAACQSG